MKEILIPLNFTATPTVYDTLQSFSTSDEASGVLTFTTTEDVAGTVVSLTIRNASENANRQTVLIERLDVNSSPFSYTFKNPLPFGQYEGTILLKKNVMVIASASFLFGVNSSLSAEVLPDLVKAYSLDELVENVETEVSNLKDAFNVTVSETVKGVNKTESTLQAQENVRYLNEHQRKANELERIANENARIAAELERKDTFDTLVDSEVIKQTVVQEVVEKYQEIEALNAPEMVSFRQQLAEKADLADLPSSAYVFKGSTTFALLPETLNTLGDVYYVTDGTPQNYAWTGTAWTPIGNGAFGNGSVTTQKIAINAVTPITTNFAVEDGIMQIFDATNLIVGRYYNGATPTSTIATDTTYATVALNLTPGETYAFTGFNEPFSRVYNGTTLKLVNTLPDFIVYNNDAYSGLPSDKIRQFTVPLYATMLYLTFRILPIMLPPMIFKTSEAIHPTEAVPYLSLIERTLTIPDLVEPIAEQAMVLGQQALDATIALGANPQNIIHVKKDGTGDFTSFVTAILSITDSSATNPYDVYVYDDHDILGELGGQAFAESLTSASDRESIFIPAYVNVYSGNVGKVTLSMELLPTWDVDYNTIKALSTIELKDGHNVFRDIIVTAKNVRYPVHDESNGGVPNTTVTWEDCEIIHYGNADFVGDPVGQWLSSCGYGSGMSSGNKRAFKNCKFYSYSFYPFSVHDNANFAIGAAIHFEDCEFINGGGNPTYYQDIKLSTYLTGSAENVAVVNNSLLSSVLIRNEVTGQTPNRWRLKGGGNYTQNMSNSGVGVPVTITI